MPPNGPNSGTSGSAFTQIPIFALKWFDASLCNMHLFFEWTQSEHIDKKKTCNYRTLTFFLFFVKKTYGLLIKMTDIALCIALCNGNLCRYYSCVTGIRGCNVVANLCWILISIHYCFFFKILRIYLSFKSKEHIQPQLYPKIISYFNLIYLRVKLNNCKLLIVN